MRTMRGPGRSRHPSDAKWRDVRDAVRVARSRQEDDRAFIVANGATKANRDFQDRELLLRLPHLVLEG
jgi:NADH:ubiquinone oxidoreductase subunit F (NADH-binding)